MSRHWIRRLTLTATVALAASVLPATDPDVVTDVRSGRHACYDRLVVDLVGPDINAAAYDVRYVPAVVEDGSGRAVPVRGAADLRVTLRAPAYDADGDATFTPPNRREVVGVDGYRTFRQVAWAGSFEGSTTLAVGVRARLPFRVFALPAEGTDAGPRLVVDVAHRW